MKNNIVSGNIIRCNIVGGNVIGVASKKKTPITEPQIYCVSNGDKYLGSDGMYYQCK